MDGTCRRNREPMGVRFRKRLRITEASIIANLSGIQSHFRDIAPDGYRNRWITPSKASPGIRVFLATSAAFRPDDEDARRILTEAKVIALARCVRNDYTKSRFSGSVAAAVYSSNRSHWSSH